MTEKSKAPNLFLNTGEDASALRKKLKLNQFEYWERISVKQSGGSRYESGRKLPNTVRLLLHLAFAPEEQALEVLRQLRAREG